MEVKNRTEGDVRVVNDQTPVWKRSPLFVKIEGFLSHIEDWLNLCSVFIIMFLMFFASAEIIGRYVFNAPVPGHVEIVELIMPAIVFLGVAYTERIGRHIRMELFVTKVLKGRAYHLAEVTTELLALFVYMFIINLHNSIHRLYSVSVSLIPVTVPSAVPLFKMIKPFTVDHYYHFWPYGV